MFVNKKHQHLQMIACCGILSIRCVFQQIFAVTCLKPDIEKLTKSSTLKLPGHTSESKKFLSSSSIFGFGNYFVGLFKFIAPLEPKP